MEKRRRARINQSLNELKKLLLNGSTCKKEVLLTRQRNNLYLPQANLTVYQKGAYYSGIKIFNNLLLEIKNAAGNQKKFKIALKKFLYTYSFIQWKSTLVNHELYTVSQDSLLYWYQFSGSICVHYVSIH